MTEEQIWQCTVCDHCKRHGPCLSDRHGAFCPVGYSDARWEPKGAAMKYQPGDKIYSNLWRRDHEKEAKLAEEMMQKKQPERGLTLSGAEEYLQTGPETVLIPFVTPIEDPVPVTLELNRTYYAVRSKKTGKHLCRRDVPFGQWDEPIAEALCIAEDEARAVSEHATDAEGNPEPVEIVQIRLVCEGVVK